MKPLTAGLIACGILVTLGMTGLLDWVMVAMGLVIAFMGTAIFQMRHSGVQIANQKVFSPEGSVLMRPFRELKVELERTHQRAAAGSVTKVISAEALKEADAIILHAEALVIARDDLRDTVRRHGLVKVETQKLERQAAECAPGAAKESLEAALQARREELTHYEQAQASIQLIEAKLAEAKAALSSLHARLLGSAGQTRADSLLEGDLNDVLRELKALEMSFEESVESLGLVDSVTATEDGRIQTRL